MLIASLAILGFSSGVIEWTRGAYMVGFFATSVCAVAFLVNLV